MPDEAFEHILNWRRHEAHLTSSGQPTERDFADLAAVGIGHIVNLAPGDSDDALADEARIIEGLGMRYTNIPVDFAAPTDNDYGALIKALGPEVTQPTHVHCIYNARVSAFLMRRAQDGLGGDENACAEILDTIWKPGGVWADFLGKTDDIAKENRYKGYDY